MSKCQKCGARCCRYFCFEIDKPTSIQEFENVRWFLMHEGVTVHVDTEGDWYIGIANRCLNLAANNRCKQYSKRPMICRSYNVGSCDFTQGDYEYKAFFNNADEFDQYARKRLGPARYDKMQAAAWAKMEKQAARQEADAAKEDAPKRKPSAAPYLAKRDARKKKKPLPPPELSDLEA